MKKIRLGMLVSIIFCIGLIFIDVDASVVVKENWNVILSDGFEESTDFTEYDNYYSTQASIISDTDVISGDNSLKIQTEYPADAWTGDLLSTDQTVQLVGGNSYRVTMKVKTNSIKDLMVEVRTGWGTNTKADMPYEFGLFVDEGNNTISRRPGWIPLDQLNPTRESYSIDTNGVITFSFEFVSQETKNAVILFKAHTGEEANASMIIDDMLIEKGPRMNEDFSKTTGDFWNSSIFWANSGAITTDVNEAINGTSLRYDYLDNSADYNVPLGGITSSKFTTALGKRHYVDFDIKPINATRFDFILNGDGMYKEALIDLVNGTIAGSFDNMQITDMTTYYHVSFEFIASSNTTNEFAFFGGAPLNENGSIVLDNFSFIVEDTVTFTPVLDLIYDKVEKSSLDYFVDIQSADLLSIRHEGNNLTSSTDYDFDSGKLVLKHNFLNTLDAGINSVIVNTNYGEYTLSFTIVDNTPVVNGNSYDEYSKSLALDLDITVDLKGYNFVNITQNSQVLDAANYTISDNTLTFKGSYLSTFNVGTHSFEINSEGGSTTFDIGIIEGIKPILSPDKSFVKGSDGSLTYTINVDYTTVTGVKLGEVLLDSDNYILIDGSLELKLDYLSTLPSGKHDFKLVTDTNEYPFSTEVIVEAPLILGEDFKIYENDSVIFNIDTKGIGIESITVNGVALEDSDYSFINNELTINNTYLSTSDQNLEFVVSTEGGSVTLKVRVLNGDEELPSENLVVSEDFENISDIFDSGLFYTDLSTIITTDPLEVINGSKSFKIATTYPANTYTPVLFTTEKDAIEIYGSNSYKVSMKFRADSFQALMFELRTGWDTNAAPDLQYDFGISIDGSNLTRRNGWIEPHLLNVSNEEYFIDNDGVIHVSFVVHSKEKAVLEIKGHTKDENASLIVDDFVVEEIPYVVETFENATSDFWNSTYFWANTGSITTDNREVIGENASLKYTFVDDSAEYNKGLGGITNTDISTHNNMLHKIAFDVRLINTDVFVFVQNATDSYSEFILNADGTYSGTFDNINVVSKGDYYHISFEFTSVNENHTFEMFAGTTLGETGTVIFDNFIMGVPDDALHVFSNVNTFNKAKLNDLVFNTDIAENDLTSISYNGTDLVKDTDYIVVDNQVTINSSFLNTLENGEKSIIVKVGDLEKTVTIAILDTRPELVSNSDADYEKSLFQDREVTLNLKGFDLLSINDGTSDLVKDVDYIVSDNKITLLNSYLTKLDSTNYTFVASTSEGSVSFTINIVDGNVPVETEEATYDFGNPNNVEFIINIPIDLITQVKVNDEVISSDNYVIETGKLTLKDTYLNTLSKGSYKVSIVINNTEYEMTLNVEMHAPVLGEKTMFTYDGEAVVVDIDLKGLDIESIKNGSVILTENDYKIDENGITITSEYLTSLEPGDNVITVKTIGGEVFFTITVPEDNSESSNSVVFIIIGSVVVLGSIGFASKKLFLK